MDDAAWNGGAVKTKIRLSFSYEEKLAAKPSDEVAAGGGNNVNHSAKCITLKNYRDSTSSTADAVPLPLEGKVKPC